MGRPGAQYCNVNKKKQMPINQVIQTLPAAFFYGCEQEQDKTTVTLTFPQWMHTEMEEYSGERLG